MNRKLESNIEEEKCFEKGESVFHVKTGEQYHFIRYYGLDIDGWMEVEDLNGEKFDFYKTDLRGN